MYVLGTAGHVDHGKSALVKALTGIDPDRLQEEKERGMTLDLGFAWLTLPSGREVSIVDVPGHERLVRNMLAGAGGIDLALLVIAADEGVMPQTREHLAILNLLKVKSGILVVTKKDLVDEEWLELVTLDIEKLVQGTFLEKAPMVAVSSVTREGLPELVNTIDKLLEHVTPRKDIGKPRLPIDRVFTISGFGTVVTGTLLDGSLAVGQEVEILPGSLRSRIRGLQTHKQKLGQVHPGSRVAANLAGLATDQLERGDVITAPGWLKPTSALDVRLHLLADAVDALAHNASVTFHSGSSEVPATVRLLEKKELEPGETTWAQLRLDKPVAVVKGDLFVIRSSRGTIGGGEIIDPLARRHRRFHTATMESLAAMEKGSPRELLLAILSQNEPQDMAALAERCHLSLAETRPAVEALASEQQVVVLDAGSPKPSTLLFSAEGWRQFSDKVHKIVQAYHHQYPLRYGIPKEELKSRLKLPARGYAEAVARLVHEGILVEEQTAFRLPIHQIRLSKAQQEAVAAFLASLLREPYSPPSDQIPEPELLNLLVEQGKVVRVSENVVFGAAVYQEMVKKITEHIKAKGKITVADVRDMFNTSRKYALALMEYLDEQKVTRRVGDERVLR